MYKYVGCGSIAVDSAHQLESSTFRFVAPNNHIPKSNKQVRNELLMMATQEQIKNPVLLVIEGPLRGHKWMLNRDAITIGRGGASDVVIPDQRISREHVQIIRTHEGYVVEDLASKNGTHVNSTELTQPQLLREGDEIQIALCVRIKFIGDEATIDLDESELPITPLNEGQALQLDERKKAVSVDGHILDPQLSPHQFRLLQLLYDAEGAVCTRDEVVQAVWPDADIEGVSEQAIDALVRRLRDRLAELSPDHQFVVTVRGYGFRFEQPN